jgi:hypothetical protein
MNCKDDEEIMELTGKVRWEDHCWCDSQYIGDGEDMPFCADAKDVVLTDGRTVYCCETCIKQLNELGLIASIGEN